jgi:peptidyl-prolyl cis-trans isomerase C
VGGVHDDIVDDRGPGYRLGQPWRRCYDPVMPLSVRLVVVFTSAVGLCAAMAACGADNGKGSKPGARAQSGAEVARVAGEVVTVDDLQKKLDEQSPFIRARYADPEKRKELLDAQVRFEVLAAEAKARGYDDDPEVRDALKKLLVQRLTREEFDGRVQLKDITDAELQKYYEAHRADYEKPEMVRASVITVLAVSADARSKAEEAQRLAGDPAKKDDRVYFKELVTRFSSDDTTKPAGGDVRYLSRDEAATRFGAEAADWLFASEEPNAVSPVFSSTAAAGQAFHVFKRTGKRKALSRSFEQVKNQIKNVVYREKRTAAFNAFVDELKVKHGAVVFPDKLDGLKIPALPAEAQAGLLDGHADGAHSDDDNGEAAGGAPGVGSSAAATGNADSTSGPSSGASP